MVTLGLAVALVPAFVAPTSASATQHPAPPHRSAVSLGSARRGHPPIVRARGVAADATAGDVYNNTCDSKTGTCSGGNSPNPAMTSVTVHLIFWSPSTLQDGTSSGTYPAGVIPLLQRFFNDLNGSGLFKIATQYYGTGFSHIQDSLTWGGAYTDADPLPTNDCGSVTFTNCVSDSSIQSEVAKAQGQLGWNRGLGDLYLMYLPPDEGTCTPGGCDLPGSENTLGCGDHDVNLGLFGDIFYATLPYPSDACVAAHSPNGNASADSLFNATSHEFMEALTDPYLNAWRDPTQPLATSEIGDKCAYDLTPQYQHPALDDGNADVYLNGRPYLLQGEWSNAAPSVGGVRCSLDGIKNSPVADATPDITHPNYQVVVGGQFLPADTEITAYYQTGLKAPNPTQVPICSGITDNSGSLLNSIGQLDCDGLAPLPADVGPYGAHQIKLTTSSGQVVASTTVTILQYTSAAVTPAAGLPGTAVTVTGVGYLPGERVDVDDANDGITLCSGTVAGNQSVSCRGAIPLAAPIGLQTLNVTGETTGDAATAYFTVTHSLAVTLGPPTVHETTSSGVHAVITVHDNASFAGEDVEISSPQLQAACGGDIAFTAPDGTTGVDSIDVTLDGTGSASASVSGTLCAPGADVVEAALPFDSGLATLDVVSVRPPSQTTVAVNPNPVHEKSHGRISASIRIESPAALQQVSITSSQLSAACGGDVTFTTAQGATSDNAVTVTIGLDYVVDVIVEGSNCALGSDIVEADLVSDPSITALTTLVVDGPKCPHCQ
jgi:hypothetical protein